MGTVHTRRPLAAFVRICIRSRAVSFLLTCPNCGVREVTDFGYGGEVTVRPASRPDAARAQHLQLLPPQRRRRAARVVVPPLRLPRLVPRRARHAHERVSSRDRRLPARDPQTPEASKAAARARHVTRLPEQPGERIDRAAADHVHVRRQAGPRLRGRHDRLRAVRARPAHVQPLVQVPPAARRAVRLRPVRELARADRRPPRRARLRRAGARRAWRSSTRTRGPGSTST